MLLFTETQELLFTFRFWSFLHPLRVSPHSSILLSSLSLSSRSLSSSLFISLSSHSPDPLIHTHPSTSWESSSQLRLQFYPSPLIWPPAEEAATPSLTPLNYHSRSPLSAPPYPSPLPSPQPPTSRVVTSQPVGAAAQLGYVHMCVLVCVCVRSRVRLTRTWLHAHD